MKKPKIIDSALPENLRRLRQKKGITQEETANVIHVDRSTYCCYERGKTEPSLQNLKRLAAFFNTDVDTLLK